jgi:hypothetical protein
MGTEGYFPGTKPALCEVDNSPPPSAVFKNRGTSLPYTFSWCIAQLIMYREIFTFTRITIIIYRIALDLIRASCNAEAVHCVLMNSIMFSLLHIFQTGSGVHTASYPMSTGGSSPEVKQPGRETDYSPPTSARSRKCGSIHPLPHTPS